MKKQFAVIGLGGFGHTVAQELVRLGHDVLGVDSVEERANQLSEYLTQTVIVDATDEEALGELDMARFDAVMVAIGDSIEASILCTMAAKKLEARELWVKAITPLHHDIAKRLGADRIYLPEYEMGLRVAQSMAYPNMLDYMSLGDDSYVIEIRPGEDMDGKPVSELALDDSGVTLLAIKHGVEVTPNPPAGQTLKSNDHLVLIGTQEALRRFTERL
jgi:trk system potassium uptake protein TrkA